MAESLKMYPDKAMDVLERMLEYEAANPDSPGRNGQRKRKCRQGIDCESATPDSPRRDQGRKKRKGTGSLRSLESVTSPKRRLLSE